MSEFICHEDVGGNMRLNIPCEGIVRCRDCDLSQKDGTCCVLFAGWEPVEGGDEYELVSADVEPDGFCKWGKRKEKTDE